MFFLCSVFGCGQVSSSLCVGLVKLASLETNRYSFFLCFGTKKLYDVVVVVVLLLFFFFELVSSTCGSFAAGCTVCLFVCLIFFFFC